MKIHHAVAVLVGLTVPLLPAPARAQTINVQLAGDLYTGAGADALAGDDWFLVPGGSQSNVAVTTDSTGNALTGVSFTVGANGSFGLRNQPNGNNLVDFYDYTGSSTFSISGLAADTPFTIYLYGTPSNQQNGARSTEFTLAGANGGGSAVAASRLTTEPSTTFLVNFDYVVLTGTTDGDGTISGTYTGFSNDGGEADFNGFQLNIAPEPSTYAMLLMGLGMLILLPRLRRS